MFIKFVKDVNGDRITINTDYIRTIRKLNHSPNCTELSLDYGHRPIEITVRGSYEDITEMIVGAVAYGE